MKERKKERKKEKERRKKERKKERRKMYHMFYILLQVHQKCHDTWYIIPPKHCTTMENGMKRATYNKCPTFGHFSCYWKKVCKITEQLYLWLVVCCDVYNYCSCIWDFECSPTLLQDSTHQSDSAKFLYYLSFQGCQPYWTQQSSVLLSRPPDERRNG